MPSPATARLACASPAFVAQATATQLADWLAYVDPDAVLLAGDSAAPRAARTLRRTATDAAVVQPGGRSPASGPRTIGGVQFVFAPTRDALREMSRYERCGLDPDTPTYVISGLLALDVEPTTLSATLVGREAYRAALSPEQLAGTYRHISTRLPAEYRREWDELSVVGGGVAAGDAETPLVALDCRADGRVVTRTIRRSTLGLRALDAVGGKRARRLREAGFTSREDLADAPVRRLTDVEGVGRTTARRIRQSARAIANGAVVRTGDAPLPSGDPVYVDVETDGLNPTIAWMVGVLDGGSDGGRFLSFVQRDPDAPGRAIEAFLTWYTANARHRPLVAYGGWNFDFEVVHDHVVEYCPRFEDDWTGAHRFDPYEWAVDGDNAILPGRTNRLADVAGALGYERTGAGLTGAAIARAYRRWMAERSPATEPDWDRAETYCEDDVRSLAAVYEALEASGRTVSTADPSPDVRDTTTQGRLSDW